MKVPVCILLIIVGLAGIAGGVPYVSLNGSFYITLPDDWEQVDYNTVDLFMRQRGVSVEGLGYEAAFAAKENSPFFDGNYLILAVDTVGNLNDDQIDSVLEELRKVFNEEVQYYPVGDLQANLKSNTPYYDKEKKVAIILNDVTQRAESFRKNLLFYKFYDRGVAKFYFYTPDSLLEQSRPVFEQMVASMSTEDIESKLPGDEVEITNVDGSSSEGSSTSKQVLPVAVLVAIFIVIMVARKKRRSRQAKDNTIG